MAVTTINLNSNAYLTLDDVKDWLNIDLTVTKYDNKIKRLINSSVDEVERYIDGPVMTRAFTEVRDGNSSNVIVPSQYPVREIQEIQIDYNRNFADNSAPATLTFQDLLFTAVQPGPSGNVIGVLYVGGATAGSEVVTVTGNSIQVKIQANVSTATQILAALTASAPALTLVTPTISGVGSHAQIIQYTDYTYLARDIPDIIKPENRVLRGQPDLNQKPSDVAILVKGQDIVLRDDNSTALLGRIFAGSVIQSIKLTYTAGWGLTAAALPQDLVQATLMLVEFRYFLRENRDLGINSRGNTNGQNYRRDRQDTGLPNEITSILDRYVDVTLGIADVGQSNTFTI